jgi:putative endonuclease
VVRTPGFSAEGGSASGGHPDYASMFYVYILKSSKDNGYYIGSCDKLELRLKNHNQGKTKSIKHRIPFELFYSEEYETRSEARKRELQLKKSYKARQNLLSKIDFYREE